MGSTTRAGLAQQRQGAADEHPLFGATRHLQQPAGSLVFEIFCCSPDSGFGYSTVTVGLMGCRVLRIYSRVYSMVMGPLRHRAGPCLAPRSKTLSLLLSMWLTAPHTTSLCRTCDSWGCRRMRRARIRQIVTKKKHPHPTPSPLQ